MNIVMKKLITSLVVCAFVASACTKDNGDDTTPPEGEVTVPELPADPQPDNTSFRHRILLLQHTGTACPNCPRLASSLKELSEDQEYAAKYHHVAAHSYNQNDPAYSKAAKNLSDPFCNAYPELSFNLTTENIGLDTSVKTINVHFDGLHKETADAGISASVHTDGSTIVANVEIKAAVENNYRIAAWVLEDNIEGRQDGATEEWHHTHHNAIRGFSGSSANIGIYGEKIGVIGAGKTGGSVLKIDIEEDWNIENCKVLVLVNGLKDGKYDVINCALCPIGGKTTYNYK